MLAKSNLVTSQWLNDNIQRSELIVLYTQMDNPVTGKADSEPVGFIPKSIFFDFEKVFSDTTSLLPHTMPSETNFTQGAQKLGIGHNSIIVIYDNKGIYCAPRVWWMFKAMGHQEVYVLNGGLPKWLAENRPTVAKLASRNNLGNFQARYDCDTFINADNLLEKLANIFVLDARSVGRFNGTQAEPRMGLRSGHIPTSINLPFTQCVEETELKDFEGLKTVFSQLGLNFERPIVFSCGSGVTACILVLAASEVGYTKLAVYDGSWSEWGARMDLPVVL